MNPMTHAEALKALFVEGADLDLTDRHAAQYALSLAGAIERAAQRNLDSMVDGNDALRAVADEPPFSGEPFADRIRETLEARKAYLRSALAARDIIPVATPAEDERMDEIEARQTERAHPAPNFAPLDMVSFAADSLGLRKGA